MIAYNLAQINMEFQILSCKFNFLLSHFSCSVNIVFVLSPLIDLFTQLLPCRHQGCFAIYTTCCLHVWLTAVFITHLRNTRLSIDWVQLPLWNIELPHFHPTCYRFQNSSWSIALPNPNILCATLSSSTCKMMADGPLTTEYNTEWFRVHLNHPTTQQLIRIVRFETAGLACKLIFNCRQYVVAQRSQTIDW